MDFVSLPSIPIRWRYAGILFLLLPFAACQRAGIPLTRFEDSPIIDSLLAAAPHLVVNTDIGAERWTATARIGLPNDSLILGQPSHMMAIGDSVYISQYPPSHIFAVGADGYLRREIGRPGEGPGEFTFISGLQYNGSHVFVKEMERVQVFTEKFEYLDSFFSLDIEHGRFSVSPDYMFLQCPWDVPQEYDWLVCARSTSPPYDWIPSIELLPGLDLPNQSGENGNLVTVTPDGDRIALAYKGLPYIFVYDDQFRHVRTIRFEGKEVENFQPAGFPGTDIAELPAGTDAFTQAFLLTMKFVDSRYLIVRAAKGGGNGDYILDVSEDDYRLAKKIVFRPMDDSEERKDIVAKDYLLYGDHLYVSSIWQEYVYGYPFDL
ncbi:MAG: hypothetical protein F4065_02080 [Rhodothermaceae bacterium]|nr:hypothetical protein [Rhodothermaceae bacterium]MXZ57398.1 hypothetical protein [Rhodothermaceae bacterium]MYB90563.1 hypothetical protein [Rhodothermaceae bacterium]MYD68311.1 hypothetical protein [Rhodothermaceae bacterium]MYG44300.1 hypothetical protein [Rhodothermaceae bacterium]